MSQGTVNSAQWTVIRRRVVKPRPVLDLGSMTLWTAVGVGCIGFWTLVGMAVVKAVCR